MADKYLYEVISDKMREYRLNYSEIPVYITDNLKFDLFDWQSKALLNFFDFLKIKQIENASSPTHLLFNMATGTGKTLLMASLILYYYEQGYRNFIFFVNQNNIVGKTEDNLTDPGHNKYLFTNPIVINDRIVNIKKVDYFSNDTDDIEIIFTSIHKLHNAVYLVKENSIFLEDLQERKLVLLADEAHHLNADTRAGGQMDLNLIGELKDNASASDVEKSWEHTVTQLILNRGNRFPYEMNPNVLLEFTATVPKNENVLRKYLNKIVYRFDLEDFLKAGFTKEINLVSSNFNKKQRVLQALLFNWYRYELALKHKIPHFKPVILFRSKFVTEDKEENIYADYDLFRDVVDNLSVSDFDFVKTLDQQSVSAIYLLGQSRIVDIVKYIKEQEVKYNTIITYLQDNFKEQNCIITHSKDKSATGRRGEDKTTSEQDSLLNSLEDKNNHITAVFTCQRLTEGWDVLNLYDIIRMYEGRDEGKTTSGKRKAGSSTVSEVQLIGRGVRYYPFKYEDKIPNKRKFDNDLQNELRILEEFYFHSDKDERYINELKNELKRQKLLPEQEKQLKLFDFKDEIKNDKNSFYNRNHLYHNEKIDNPNRRKKTLDDIRKSWEFIYKAPEISISEVKVMLETGKVDKHLYESGKQDSRTVPIFFNKIPRHISYKALNVISKREKSMLRYDALAKELDITSKEDLIKDNFFGLFPIHFVIPAYLVVDENALLSFENLSPNIQVDMLVQFWTKISDRIVELSNPFLGSEFQSVPFKAYFSEPKQISVVQDPANSALEEILKNKDWYALKSFYGTSEERALAHFLIDTMENFKDKYTDINLVRNEEVYKIYDFKTGKGFMPDFLLFMKSKDKDLYYQVFIEPKGSQFMDSTGTFNQSKEAWKQEFLEEITKRYAGDETLLKKETDEYKLIGLPLYNVSSANQFKQGIMETLKIKL
jgi:type III restriction enzyme